MNFLSRLFGRRKAPLAVSVLQSQSSSGSSHSSKIPAMSQDMRRELLRVTLRETLRRHGIPLDWIGADMLTATSRSGQTGIHWRLSIRHWDPRLMIHVVALQNRLISRLQMVDPMAETWLMGVSWQVAVPDESACPALPHPGSWTVPPTHLPAGKREGPASGGSADVIAGPVRIENARRRGEERPRPADGGARRRFPGQQCGRRGRRRRHGTDVHEDGAREALTALPWRRLVRLANRPLRRSAAAQDSQRHTPLPAARPRPPAGPRHCRPDVVDLDSDVSTLPSTDPPAYVRELSAR